MILIDEAFDLEFLLTNAGGLIPVKLGFPYRTIRQLNISDALPFPPMASSIKFAQAREFADSIADGERFHIDDFAANLEGHVNGILSAVVATLSFPA
jgi:hypothetical protein